MVHNRLTVATLLRQFERPNGISKDALEKEPVGDFMCCKTVL